MQKKRLGQVLREQQLIDDSELDAAIAQQQQEKLLRLGEVLLRRGTVKKQDLAAALQQVTGVPYTDADSLALSPAVLEFIPEQLARKHCVLPLQREGRFLAVLMAEPQDLPALDELRFYTGMEIAPHMAFRADILNAIDRHYGSKSECPPEVEPDAGNPVEFFISSSSKISQTSLREFQAEMTGERTPAVRLVSNLVAAAAAKGASDIHMEQTATDLVVRIRVDGLLRELMHIPAEQRLSVVSRVKILADMDIAERRTPQDGRCLARVGDRQIDLRISTLPTQYGEKIVMRLLDPAAASVSFQELGFSPTVSSRLERLLAQPQGMLLVTGPTGSGKSTTLYAALNSMRSPRVNISTIEDPIEYVLEGVNQVQVNTKAGPHVCRHTTLVAAAGPEHNYGGRDPRW